MEGHHGGSTILKEPTTAKAGLGMACKSGYGVCVCVHPRGCMERHLGDKTHRSDDELQPWGLWDGGSGVWWSPHLGGTVEGELFGHQYSRILVRRGHM